MTFWPHVAHKWEQPVAGEAYLSSLADFLAFALEQAHALPSWKLQIARTFTSKNLMRRKIGP
jgi:hypothetical protein